MFSGDSRSVLFRLQPSQDGVLHGWFRSVPDIVAALRSGVSPQTLEQVLRRVGCIGVLTAKEIFVHLSYACPHVADTTRHVPVGGGALAGAALVLSYGRGLRGSDEARCGARQAHGVQRGGFQVPGQGPRSLRTSEPKHTRSDVWGRRATLAIADLLNWAMASVGGGHLHNHGARQFTSQFVKDTPSDTLESVLRRITRNSSNLVEQTQARLKRQRENLRRWVLDVGEFVRSC